MADAGCTRPAGGPVEEESQAVDNQQPKQEVEERKMLMVGQKVPDFAAPGYHKGEFINVNLSDYFGKWIVLCFYPGDFTFV